MITTGNLTDFLLIRELLISSSTKKESKSVLVHVTLKIYLYSQDYPIKRKNKNMKKKISLLDNFSSIVKKFDIHLVKQISIKYKKKYGLKFNL